MKKGFLLFCCLISTLFLFSQNKDNGAVRYERKKSAVNIKIPANTAEPEFQEFFVKNKKAAFVMLYFFKEDVDTATCIIDVDYIYPKTKSALLDSLLQADVVSGPSLYPTRFVGENTTPIYVNKNASFIITFNRYNRIFKYKINFELKPKVYPKGSDL